jgi:hypothetical protein
MEKQVDINNELLENITEDEDDTTKEKKLLLN